MNLHDRVDNDFTYHDPKPGQPVVYEGIRDEARQLAHYLITQVPEGRELSTALSKLEEVVFWANAGIARNV